MDDLGISGGCAVEVLLRFNLVAEVFERLGIDNSIRKFKLCAVEI